MTSFNARFSRIILAGLISGLVVCWVLVISGWIYITVYQAFTLPVANVGDVAKLTGEFLLNAIAIGLLGSLYGVAIGFGCAIACMPATMLLIGFAERRGYGSGLFFTVGGGLAAVATAVVLGLGMALVAQLDGGTNPAAAAGALDTLQILLLLSVGGPIAGYIYWRLARTEMLAARTAA